MQGGKCVRTKVEKGPFVFLTKLYFENPVRLAHNNITFSQGVGETKCFVINTDGKTSRRSTDPSSLCLFVCFYTTQKSLLRLPPLD